jgi:hypothetical protein
MGDGIREAKRAASNSAMIVAAKLNGMDREVYLRYRIAWPHHPKSLFDWALLFLIALPVTVLGEWLTDGLVNNPLSAIIECGTRRSGFSWTRIAYYLAIYILLAIAAVALFYGAQA